LAFPPKVTGTSAVHRRKYTAKCRVLSIQMGGEMPLFIAFFIYLLLLFRSKSGMAYPTIADYARQGVTQAFG
jgi:hypothetical protein